MKGTTGEAEKADFGEGRRRQLCVRVDQHDGILFLLPQAGHVSGINPVTSYRLIVAF
jgi:hypothetical protein